MRRLTRLRWPVTVAMGAMISSQFALPLAYANSGLSFGNHTRTPIKHVIVLIGENRTFDNVYGTYAPKKHQQVENLLSEKIVTASGAPGTNASIAAQFEVNTPLPASYFISSNNKTAYTNLPTPELNGAPNGAVSVSQLNSDPTGVQPPFDNSFTTAQLETLEPSLEVADLALLQTGATGEPGTTGLDPRITNATSLPNTAFQITGPNVPYDSYTGDTVHRLFHMWQQSDCDVANATPANPSGCLNDLYPFVATARDDSGGNSLGFYNMQNGDAPVMKELADEYALSDNFHQSAMGGTAGNHMTLGTGDSIFWTPFNGVNTPPASKVANPVPTSTSSDKYKADQAWTNCSDTSQPGIAPIVNYLASLPNHPNPNCESGHFYMINNLSPGFLPNGTIDTANITTGNKVPPSSLRTIGDALNEKNISWAYYGGGYNAAVRVANGSTDPFDKIIAQNYCDICNFESYANSIMGDATQRTAHIKDATDFFAALEGGNLPAVSFVKPD
ncbi:MAG TPA: alkaline phosphatase family protein, partial [Candidatus Binataceae bacterium]|nr:alkaline phosphatase family protein [Candidatus Binataceae bacterium]